MELKEITGLEANDNSLWVYRVPDDAIHSTFEDKPVEELSFLSIPYDDEVVVAATG